MNTAARKYTPLWNRIKSEITVVIRCSQSDVETVKRELKKEKCRDAGFRLMNEDVEKPYLKIETAVDPNNKELVLIKFTLKTKLGIVEIV